MLMTTFSGRVVEAVADRFTELPRPPGKQGEGYLGAVDDAGRWCVVQNVFTGTWDGTAWVPLVPAEDLKRLNGDQVSVAPARACGLWILLGRELRRYAGGQVAERHTLPEDCGGVWHLFEDSSGHLWLSSCHAGLARLSPDGRLRAGVRRAACTRHGARCLKTGRGICGPGAAAVDCSSSASGASKPSPRRRA